MTKKLVIFDFDGVLVNTNDLNYSLQTAANPHLPKEYFAKLSEGNFHENLARAIKEDAYVVHPKWFEEYEKGLLKLSTHDIIRNLVLDLAKEHTLAIVSSSETGTITKMLLKENIRGHFRDVLGADVHTSKEVKIRHILDTYGVAAADTVFVTDTTGDVKEALPVGVRSIGVTWGLHTSDALKDSGAVVVVDSVIALEEAIKALLG